MSIQAPAQLAPIVLPRPDFNSFGRLAFGFLALLGLGALAGGIALVAAPDGSIMGFSTEALEGTFFRNYTTPGLILGGFFGLGSFAAAWGGFRRRRWAPFLAFTIGLGMMTWILVQMTIIEFSWLQPICFAIGLLIATASVPWGWPTFQAWRERRKAETWQ